MARNSFQVFGRCRSYTPMNRILENILNKLPYEGELWSETTLLVIYYENP